MNILRIVTVPFFAVNHLGGQISDTVKYGHNVVVITSPGLGIQELCEESEAEYYPLDIERGISLFKDIMVIFRLINYLRKNKFDIVHSVTPKAGLLASIASRIMRVPVRLHTFTGQRWAELKGPLRWVTKASDWLIIKLNTKCYADSKSQVEFIVEQGVCDEGAVSVLDQGSLSGVDFNKYDIDKLSHVKDEVRKEIGVVPEAKVLIFLGRVTRDKGMRELVDSFDLLSREIKDIHLVVVGPLEHKLDPLHSETLKIMRKNENIHAVGYKADCEKYIAISDVMVIPSYREGFGNVVIEAAAMGVPSVGTRIPGLVDSIEDGETGVLVPAKNSDALTDALRKMLNDDDYRRRLGANARKRAKKHYDQSKVNLALLKEYDALAALHGIAVMGGGTQAKTH